MFHHLHDVKCDNKIVLKKQIMCGSDSKKRKRKKKNRGRKERGELIAVDDNYEPIASKKWSKSNTVHDLLNINSDIKTNLQELDKKIKEEYIAKYIWPKKCKSIYMLF